MGPEYGSPQWYDLIFSNDTAQCYDGLRTMTVVGSPGTGKSTASVKIAKFMSQVKLNGLVISEQNEPVRELASKLREKGIPVLHVAARKYRTENGVASDEKEGGSRIYGIDDFTAENSDDRGKALGEYSFMQGITFLCATISTLQRLSEVC